VVLSITALAQAPSQGRVLGIVTDPTGTPLADAIVRLLPAGLHPRAELQRTALNGSFAFAHLTAGTYYVEAGRGQRVSGRQKVQITAAHTAYLALPLLYALGSLRVSAPESGSAEDFGWLLRANNAVRPLLRWQEANEAPAHLSGYVSVMAGGSAAPQSDPGAIATTFQLQRQAWGDSELAFAGSVGTSPAGVAGTASQLSAIFEPHGEQSPARLVITLQQIPLPPLAHVPSVQAVSFNYADGLTAGRLSVQYGAMFDTVSLVNSFHTLDPYLRLQWQAGAHAHWEYRFATAVPPVHFGPTYAEAAATPRLALDDFAAQMERAHHQELGYEDQLTANDLLEAAAFVDHFTHAVVAGTGAQAADLASGNLLPDPLTNTFSADGGNYGGWGARLVFDHRVSGNLSASLGWAEGPVLAPRGARVQSALLGPDLAAVRRQALTVKLAGELPVTHTRVACSYRWLNGTSVTAVDPYDDSPDQSDSYANITIRQPLPRFAFGTNRVEALAEFHNLLAQGYLPVMSADGHLLYLIQAARSFRGGLSFNF